MSRTVRVTVKWAGQQKERRFSASTPVRVRKAWKADALRKLMKRSPQPERRAPRGTLAADAERYYPQIKHFSDWGQRRSEIRAWIKAGLGETHRHMITQADVLRIRGRWIEAGVAPQTVNNRMGALRSLYHVLDGADEPTPADRVKPLSVPKVPPQIIDPVTIARVMDTLQLQADAGKPYAAKDRARFMVLASTGKRPCELKRAQPGDVDLRRRVWVARDAKGGFSPGAYLNDEMVMAWEAFILAEAWGPYDTTHFVKRLRKAGWPKGVRPYNLRHSTWIEASERGNDLADIQAGAGHKLMTTTRRHYVPVRDSRLQRMSESLEGRLGWTR